MFDSMKAYNRLLEIKETIEDAHALINGRFDYAPLGMELLAKNLTRVRDSRKKVQEQHKTEWMFALCWEDQRRSLEKFRVAWSGLDEAEEYIHQRIYHKIELLREEHHQLDKQLRVNNYYLWRQTWRRW